MKGRYILTLQQTKRFIQHRFGPDRFEPAAEMVWYPMNAEARTDYVNLFTRTSVEFNDNYLAIGNSAKVLEHGFIKENLPTRTLPYDNKY